jgi:hypothetical protein
MLGRGRGMRRIMLTLLVVALAASFGCITADDKRQWQEALKDLRGDNLEMKTMPSKKPTTSSSD